ncbi:MAG: nucleotide exchange factor GrpE [Candidatus Brocadiia bacterium]
MSSDPRKIEIGGGAEEEGPEAEPSAEDSQALEEPEQEAGQEEANESPAAVQLSYAEYEELKTLARERDEFLQRLQRAVADYQNLQKRIERFRETARQEITRSVGEVILPVADSLSLALQAAEDTEGGEKLVEGLRLVEKDFYGALEKLGIQPVVAVGEKFDPHYHEAVMQEPREDIEPNTVVRELKKGFVQGDQVIRPSQVIVSSVPPDAEGA